MSARGFSDGFAKFIKSSVASYTPEQAIEDFEMYFTEKRKSFRAGTLTTIKWTLPSKFMISPKKQECLQAINDNLIALGCKPTSFYTRERSIHFINGQFAFLCEQRVPHDCNQNFCQKDGCPSPELITCNIAINDDCLKCSQIVFCMHV